jgi:hypothetical protein
VRRFVPHACERCGGRIEWVDHQPYGERPERRRPIYLCARHGAECVDPRQVTVEDLALIRQAQAWQRRWEQDRRDREDAYRARIVGLNVDR